MEMKYKNRQKECKKKPRKLAGFIQNYKLGLFKISA